MTKNEDRSKLTAIEELLERDEDFVRSAVQSFVQEALEAEMTEALAAEKGERTEGRLGYRSGYYQRALITRVGLAEMYVQGVSTRKVKAVTEALYGHSFSASSISASTRHSMRTCGPFPNGAFRTLSLTSSSMPVTSGCARAA